MLRTKRKGGGVSLYIHSALQYKLKRYLQLGGDVDSVFIEIYISCCLFIFFVDAKNKSYSVSVSVSV